MSLVITIVTVVLLGFVAWQDIKFREISWISMPVLFILLFYKGAVENNVWGISRLFLINVGISAFILLTLVIYFSAKNGRWTNILKHYLGLGDVLMLAVMATMLSPLNFVLLYTVICIITILGFVFVSAIKPGLKAEIPLAGIMAIFMGSTILLHDNVPMVNMYDDFSLFKIVS